MCLWQSLWTSWANKTDENSTWSVSIYSFSASKRGKYVFLLFGRTEPLMIRAFLPMPPHCPKGGKARQSTIKILKISQTSMRKDRPCGDLSEECHTGVSVRRRDGATEASRPLCGPEQELRTVHLWGGNWLCSHLFIHKVQPGTVRVCDGAKNGPLFCTANVFISLELIACHSWQCRHAIAIGRHSTLQDDVAQCYLFISGAFCIATPAAAMQWAD